MESELVDKAIQKLNKESSPDTLQEDRDTDKLPLSRLLSEVFIILSLQGNPLLINLWLLSVLKIKSISGIRREGEGEACVF